MRKRGKASTACGRMFASSMKKAGRSDAAVLYWRYRTLYDKLKSSDTCKEFSKYKTMSIDMVYAAIAHALICFDLGYSFDEALEIREKYSAVKVRELLSALCTMFDLMMELNVALG